MAFDRTTYQREYMRRRRAEHREKSGKAKSRADAMQAALTAILAKLDGNDKSLAVELRRIATEGLANA